MSCNWPLILICMVVSKASGRSGRKTADLSVYDDLNVCAPVPEIVESTQQSPGLLSSHTPASLLTLRHGNQDWGQASHGRHDVWLQDRQQPEFDHFRWTEWVGMKKKGA